jgi:DNA topoisomerase III
VSLQWLREGAAGGRGAAAAAAAAGLVITARNYLDVYPYDQWSNRTVPPFQRGERVVPTSLELQPGATTAPDMLSEADLITLMDKNGIGPEPRMARPPFPRRCLTPCRPPTGTDATIHEHIKKIQERQYAFKQNNLFYPSTLGVALVTGYDAMGFELSKPGLRAQVCDCALVLTAARGSPVAPLQTEMELRHVCDGTKTKVDMLRRSIAQYREVFVRANHQVGKLAEVRRGVCPRTRGPIVTRAIRCPGHHQVRAGRG